MKCPICGAPTTDGSPVALVVNTDGTENEVTVCDPCGELLAAVGYMPHVAGQVGAP